MHTVEYKGFFYISMVYSFTYRLFCPSNFGKQYQCARPTINLHIDIEKMWVWLVLIQLISSNLRNYCTLTILFEMVLMFNFILSYICHL